jgi:hypothetical protein
VDDSQRKRLEQEEILRKTAADAAALQREREAQEIALKRRLEEEQAAQLRAKEEHRKRIQAQEEQLALAALHAAQRQAEVDKERLSQKATAEKEAAVQKVSVKDPIPQASLPVQSQMRVSDKSAGGGDLQLSRTLLSIQHPYSSPSLQMSEHALLLHRWDCTSLHLLLFQQKRKACQRRIITARTRKRRTNN